jgi:hypothetical protein
MENIVKLGARRQREADSHLVDELNDAVRPEVPRLELAFGRL